MRPPSTKHSPPRRSLLLFTILFLSGILISWRHVIHLSPRVTLVPSHQSHSPSPDDNPPVNPHQRIAVCFAGHARTLRYNFTHALLHKHVIAPLRRQRDTVVDIFFILRTDDQPARNRPVATRDDDATRAAVASFDAVNVTWLTETENDASDGDGDSEAEMAKIPGWMPRTDTQHERIRPPPHCSQRKGDPTLKPVRFPHALYRAKQCLDTIHHHEQQTRTKYDWVYRMRPDVVLLQDIPLPAKLNPTTAYTNQGRENVTRSIAKWWRDTKRQPAPRGEGVADTMSITPRRLTDVFLSAWEAVFDCDLFRAPIYNAPENVLRFWLHERGVQYISIPFDWVIVREGVGPECGRLVFQRGEGVDIAQSMAKCAVFAEGVREFFPDMPQFNVSVEATTGE